MSSRSNLEGDRSEQGARLPIDSSPDKSVQDSNSSSFAEKPVSRDNGSDVVEDGFGESEETFEAGDDQSNNEVLANLYNLINDVDLDKNIQQPQLDSLEPVPNSFEQIYSTKSVQKSDSSIVNNQNPLPLSELEQNLGNYGNNDELINPPTFEGNQTDPSYSVDANQAGSSTDFEVIDLGATDPEFVNPEVVDLEFADSSISQANNSDSKNLEYADDIYEPNYADQLAKQELTPELSPSIPLIKIGSPDPELGNSPQVSPHWIVEKERKINELADSLNSLLPLVVELSQAQADSSREHILKNLVPIIDQVIQKRSVEDQQKMARAIANILPTAIKQEIRQEPKSIGQAIAPELALSITEQIRLDENAIAEALGSEMGKAIKNQIEQEREAMVDALYPVIGSTIAKYMAEVVESINQKVDNALSPQGIQRKFRAKLQGVSEAELILRESIPYRVQAAFLIQNNSGLVIAEVQPEQESKLESDLLAGMLTAIRSFANDCITSNSDLDEIDYGNFQIMFETAGYCYLAVVVKGEANLRFSKHMENILGKIIQKYGDEIKAYQGEQDTELTAALVKLLRGLLRDNIETNSANSENNPPKSSQTLYWLLGIFALLILVPWGTLRYRHSVRQSIENEVAIRLDANPELSVYRLTPKINKQKILLKGRVPNEYLLNLATQVTVPIAQKADLGLDNQIVAIQIPPDPTLTEQEVERTVRLINPQNSFDQNQGVAIDASYLNKTVTLKGAIFDEVIQNKLIKNFKVIPGVDNVIFVVSGRLPQLNTRIYFASGATDVPLSSESIKLDEVLSFLKKYPGLGLKMISHSDNVGSQEANRRLGQERVDSISQYLFSQGINSDRLRVMVTTQPPPDIIESQSASLKRCIRFEPFDLRSN